MENCGPGIVYTLVQTPDTDGATKLRLTLHTYYNGMGSIRITDGGRLVSVKVGSYPQKAKSLEAAASRIQSPMRRL